MATMARQLERDPFFVGVPELVRALVEPRSRRLVAFARAFAGDDLTSRAIAAAGVAALVALPIFLLSSVVFAIPLAVPAAIGACYLAVSRALSASRPRQANLINAGILLGLVGWPIGFLLAGEGSLSQQNVTVALIAPLFSAAPALARFAIARTSKTAGGPNLRDAALQRVGNSERLSPAEHLLVLDRNGAVLAASQGARRELGLLPDAFEYALTGLLNAEELRRVFESIGRCLREKGSIGFGLTFETLESDRPLRATLSSCGDGLVEMRLRGNERTERHSPLVDITGTRVGKADPIDSRIKPVVDIGETVRFALHRVARRAEKKKIAITSALEPGTAAICDGQTGRRILHQLIDHALAGCEANGAMHIETRRLRGVALVRTITSPRICATNTSCGGNDRTDMVALEILVDGAGGTIVCDERDGKSVVSARLPLAPVAATVGKAAA